MNDSTLVEEVVKTAEEDELPPAPKQPAEEKFDNFYSPQNTQFYSKFKYAHLDPKTPSIRLLRIPPPPSFDIANQTHPIHCELLDNISLSDIEGKYTTLSYCAGDPKNTEAILVNGVEFNAFANLGHALRQARFFWKDRYQDTELLLWADQICIDQSTPSERSHQVSMMGKIYSSCKEVLVCLSQEVDDTGGFTWLRQYMDCAVPVLKTRSNSPVLVGSYLEDPHDVWPAEMERSEYRQSFAGFINTILKSQWWRRIWIRQEFILPPKATFMACFESSEAGFLAQCISKMPSNIPWTHIGSRTCSDDPNCTLRQLTDVMSYVLENYDRGLNVWIVFVELMKARYSTPTNVNIVDHITTSVNWEASDPRDKIYGLLTLSDNNFDIYPDYSPDNSFDDISIELSRNIINRVGPEHFLLDTKIFVFKADFDFPSWAHDFTKILPLRIQPTRSESNHCFHPDHQGREGRILQLSGVFLFSLACPSDWSGRKWETSQGGNIQVINGNVKAHDEVWPLVDCSWNEGFILRKSGEYVQIVGVGWHHVDWEKGRVYDTTQLNIC